ncbi:hypothetical protein C4587_02760 [Candidatus Parcubacteria bacterium]|nr:MAG: hypothetical protein C4587_02760 [Candidatus Parcubacteria bacterium]
MEKISPEERQGLEKGAFVIEPLLQTLRLYDDVIETNPPLKKKRDALELEARSSQNHEEVAKKLAEFLNFVAAFKSEKERAEQ